MKNFEEVKYDVKYWFQDVKFKARVKLIQAKDWIYNNRDYLVAVAIPAAIGIAAEARKIETRINSNIQQQKVQKHRDYDVWDPSAGIQIHCKRKMSNAERIEFSRRHANGEKTVDILKEMGLI